MSAQGIRLGTRGSALALAQAEMTEAALRTAFPGIGIERCIITTTGDRRTDLPLAQVAGAEGHLDKGVFIKELEVALAEGKIDVAVHSLKDVPSELGEGFALAGMLPRAPVGDVLLTKRSGGIDALPEGSVVATSSLRRQRMLLSRRQDLQVADIRGNVPTRLRKLVEQSDLDGLILAEAGLLRLGLLVDGRVEAFGAEVFAETLDPEWFLPAAGQGAVAFEIRAGDGKTAALCAALSHAGTEIAVTAEREFLVLLGAGCDTPAGVRCVIEGDTLRMWARVFEEKEDWASAAAAEGPCTDPRAVAQALIRNLRREQS